MSFGFNPVWFDAPRLPPNTEQVCDDCEETRATTDSDGKLPKGWEISEIGHSNGRGGFVRDGVIATCPRCVNDREREELADEWEYAHENPYR